jgi:hypothetical protein
MGVLNEKRCNNYIILRDLITGLFCSNEDYSLVIRTNKDATSYQDPKIVEALKTKYMNQAFSFIDKFINNLLDIQKESVDSDDDDS